MLLAAEKAQITVLQWKRCGNRGNICKSSIWLFNDTFSVESLR